MQTDPDKTSDTKLTVDKILVRDLIATQFPQWKNLKIQPVATSGWDNVTFHLGNNMLVRLPSAKVYELQVEKEHKWLPVLGPELPLPIPMPIAMGEPSEIYPLKWSVYRWLEGEALASAKNINLTTIASSLARFLTVFQRIDATGGPLPGLHSFYRGGELEVYDDETRKAIDCLKNKINAPIATEIWERAIETKWDHPPVWVHGDISRGNLLVKEGKLCAVIDFGQLAIGDPACDLALAWTLFKGESRQAFKRNLQLDSDTWLRGLAWTLWKALIEAAGFTNPNNAESKRALYIIDEVINAAKENT